MCEVASLLSIEEAQSLILERVPPPEVETVRLGDAAGRVTAEAAPSRVDLPPFDSSAMDGFAVRSGDTPGRLPIADRIAAGRPAARELRAGEEMAIATGGAVPPGADAVIPIEYVVEHDNEVEIGERVQAGASVRPRGGDLRFGETVVEAGVRLGPARLGALAAGGVADILCARRPHAAILSTGTELRRPGEELEPGQIYEANGTILAAQLSSAGAAADRLEAVGDDEGAHRAAPEVGVRTELVRARSSVVDGTFELDVLRGQDSHMIATAAGADALVLVPAGTDELPAGSEVSYLRPALG